ncbi:MAG: murein L,D-transpeptidase catalytic domain family protein [Bacteroidales bacterium]
MKFTNLLLIFMFLWSTSSGYLVETSAEASPGPSYDASFDRFCHSFFDLLHGDVAKPDYEVFRCALMGFFNLKADNNIKKNILTIIDYSISSKFERMWIVDLNTMVIVHRCLVAHGRNSGEEFAGKFSNAPASHESSLGFYITGSFYYGGNGLSLLLDGAEPGINDNARSREIVMHGADYVSSEFVEKYGRLGRSFGCPAIPLKDHERIIKMLAGRSCLYIHYPDDSYESSSSMLSTQTALRGIYLFLSEKAGLPKPFSGLISDKCTSR